MHNNFREKSALSIYLITERIQQKIIKNSLADLKDYSRDLKLRRLIVGAQIVVTAQKRYSSAFENWKLYIHYQKVENMKRAAQIVFDSIGEQIKGITTLVYKNDLESKKKAQALR